MYSVNTSVNDDLKLFGSVGLAAEYLVGELGASTIRGKVATPGAAGDAHGPQRSDDGLQSEWRDSCVQNVHVDICHQNVHESATVATRFDANRAEHMLQILQNVHNPPP